MNLHSLPKIIDSKNFFSFKKKNHFKVVWKKPKRFSYANLVDEYNEQGLYIWCHPLYFARTYDDTKVFYKETENLKNDLPFCGFRIHK